MSEYPERPPAGGGWPAQPPQYSGRADGQPRYQQAGYDEPGYDRARYGQGDYAQAGYSQAGYRQRTPRRRRRGRGWIALFCTLIVLAVLFVIGDQIARTYAQNVIAQRLESQSGLSTKPSVTIEGFPFLTQVAAHDIRTIDISMSNVQTNKLDITSIKATATGVHPNSSFSSATIDNIAGTALISFASIESATGAKGVTITADPSGGPNMANVSVGPLTATAQVEQTGANQITVKIHSLGGIASALLGSLPDYTINVPTLPAGLQMQGVTVTDQGVVVKVGAQNTTLSQ